MPTHTNGREISVSWGGNFLAPVDTTRLTRNLGIERRSTNIANASSTPNNSWVGSCGASKNSSVSPANAQL